MRTRWVNLAQTLAVRFHDSRAVREMWPIAPGPYFGMPSDRAWVVRHPVLKQKVL